MTTVKVQFIVKRGDNLYWTPNPSSVVGPLLAFGEPGYNTDTNQFKIGDGIKYWTQLDAISSGSSGPSGPITSGPSGPSGPSGVSNVSGPSGKSGPSGPSGPKGDQGPGGGETGPSGPSGPSGPAGRSFVPGPTGATGPSGPSGQSGPSGASGPSGPSGRSGPSGPSGASGPSGPSGPSGVSNASGPSGPSGKSGPSGPSGPKGDRGPGGGETGPSGPSGPSGPAGRSFVPGPTGPSGPSGPSGPNTGLSGPSGPSGPAGSLNAKTITLYLYYNNIWELSPVDLTKTNVESSENLTGLTLTTFSDGSLNLTGLSGPYSKLPSSFSTLVYKAGSPTSLKFASAGGDSQLPMYMNADPRGAVPVAFGFRASTLYGGYFTTNSLPLDTKDITAAIGNGLPSVKVILYYFV